MKHNGFSDRSPDMHGALIVAFRTGVPRLTSRTYDTDMPRLLVRDFDSSHIPAAAALLAARHRRDRVRLPVLDPAREAESPWIAGVESLVANAGANTAVAIRDDVVVGFAGGAQMLFAPTAVEATFLPPHSIFIGSDGHAVAEADDAVEVYRALYGYLAERWVAKGFFTHRWLMTAGDMMVQEALVSLGFGRVLTAGTRETGLPVEGRAAPLDIRTAAASDLDAVIRLSELLIEHHGQAPMFWPFLYSAEAAVHDLLRGMLAEGEPPTFLGVADEQPIAIQSFLRTGFTSPLIDHERNIYLFEGMVDPESQQAGAGTALPRHAMAWARTEGFRTCTLHFASQNFSGAPFWLKHGFEPVEHTLEHRVDERVAWAKL